jgi:hypothetical protein
MRYVPLIFAVITATRLIHAAKAGRWGRPGKFASFAREEKPQLWWSVMMTGWAVVLAMTAEGIISN